MARKPGMGERACSKCKETIKVDALICKHCRSEFSPEEVAAAKKNHGMALGLSCLVLLLLLGFCSFMGSGSENKDGPPVVMEPDAKQEMSMALQEPASSLTGPQQNAARSAQQYLSMSGFSHDGLIQQLSSDAGDGYSVSDATAAVDSLNVDWNEQAGRSAKQYLGMSGFSCDGLIQQLSSSAGDKYTMIEATYGAKQAGAC